MTLPRVPRTIPDLVTALTHHTKLLREFRDKAFVQRDEAYIGEIATKLRLLTSNRGRNKALLLRLMDLFGEEVPITLSGPIDAGKQVNLKQFLELGAGGVRTPTQGFVMLTKSELIETWAAQHGAAHEDWSLTEDFAALRDAPVFLNGLRALAVELGVTTDAVLRISETFLGRLTPERIEAAEPKRRQSGTSAGDIEKNRAE